MFTHQKPTSKRTLKDRIALSGIRKKDPATKGPVAVIDHRFRVPLQRFVIVPQEQQIIVGKLGTKIMFPANAFVYSSGVAVFEEVEIELKEVMTKRDAVRENLTTTLNDSFQESGGMLYLNASSGGANVYLHHSKRAKVLMPRSQNVFLEGTGIFTGQRLKDENINWQETDIPLQGLAKQRNMLLRRFINSKEKQKQSSEKITAFQFETGQLGWMNCDRPYSVPPNKRTNLSIETKVDHPVEMKVVLKNHNSVLPVVRKGNTYTATVPANEKVTVTGFYQQGEECYFGATQVIPGKEKGVKLNMEKQSMEEIKKRLKKL